MTLKSYLDDKRVSELHELYAFWGNGGDVPEGRDALRDALDRRMRDEATVYSRVKVLAEKPLQALLLLVRQEGFVGEPRTLVRSAVGIAIEAYEIEAAARALSKRGFLSIEKDRSWVHYGRETYVVPRELGSLIGTLLEEDRRSLAEILTLAGHLESYRPPMLARRLAAVGYANGDGEAEALQNGDASELAGSLLEAPGVGGLLGGLVDGFRKLVDAFVFEHGGVISRAVYEREFKGRAQWHRKRWQKRLEERLIGTMTTVSLREYGIDLEGESVVVFGEIGERMLLDEALPADRIERIMAPRIDLLTDLQYLLNHVARHPVRVTSEKQIYKSARQKLKNGLIFREEEHVVDHDLILDLIFDLATKLGLIRPDSDKYLQLTEAGEYWESRPLQTKVDDIFETFLEERSTDGSDFHVRKLLGRLVDLCREGHLDTWSPSRSVCFVVRNRYLASLEGGGVRERFRNRFQYTFSPPRESPAKIADSLHDWIERRLFVLGLVELGVVDGDVGAVRLTDLGRKVLLTEGDERHEDVTADHPLIVNPDFEVLLFPEGDVTEIAHQLDRFATRTPSEEVAVYRITREDVERAVGKGMATEEIHAFLGAHSKTPVPQNVTYSIRDWGGKVRFATQEPAVLFELDDEETLDVVLALPPIKKLLIRRVSPTVAALRREISDFETVDELRRLGVFLHHA